MKHVHDRPLWLTVITTTLLALSAGAALAELPPPERFPGQENAGNRPKGVPVLFAEYGAENYPSVHGDQFHLLDTRDYCQLVLDVGATRGIKVTITVQGAPSLGNRLATTDEVAPIVADTTNLNELSLTRVIPLRHSATEISVTRAPGETDTPGSYLAVYLTPIRCGANVQE